MARVMKSFLNHSPMEIGELILDRMREAHDAEDWHTYSYWSGYYSTFLVGEPMPISRKAFIFHHEYTMGRDDGVGDRESIFPSGSTDQG